MGATGTVSLGSGVQLNTAPRRFAGTVEWIAAVDSAAMAAWIATIPFEEWHQQRPVGQPLRPAMMTDLRWCGFGAVSAPLVEALLQHFPRCAVHQQMLSVVMPGDSIPSHKDEQSPRWVCRVHVPLLSNAESRFVVSGESHHLEPGCAYRVNTEVKHSVENPGSTPRIHFMFDVSG